MAKTDLPKLLIYLLHAHAHVGTRSVSGGRVRVFVTFRRDMGLKNPTSIGTTSATPTATPLVVICDGGKNLGCSRLL